MSVSDIDETDKPVSGLRPPSLLSWLRRGQAPPTGTSLTRSSVSLKPRYRPTRFMRLFRRSAPAADVEAASVAAASTSYVDDRLLGEPKNADEKAPREGNSLQGWLLRLCAVLIGCYLTGLQELVFAGFTTVSCEPRGGTVRAGTNVTCEIVTAPLSSETDLSITQLGHAGPIALLETAGREHVYRVTFSTSRAGRAGVRVTHMLLWSSASVEVVPAAATGRVEVACTPRSVRVGEEVRCTVEPRDRFGNLAEVEKPEGASSSYFSVAHTGSAGELKVQDTFVAFSPNAAGRAGVAVTLDGVRSESEVQVSG